MASQRKFKGGAFEAVHSAASELHHVDAISEVTIRAIGEEAEDDHNPSACGGTKSRR